MLLMRPSRRIGGE
uniref:Uncharacterized protein n=1 Tax=Arundo donax TaxID=35708 RepID=A0A0A9GDK6_ARUDO